MEQTVTENIFTDSIIQVAETEAKASERKTELNLNLNSDISLNLNNNNDIIFNKNIDMQNEILRLKKIELDSKNIIDLNPTRCVTRSVFKGKFIFIFIFISIFLSFVFIFS